MKKVLFIFLIIFSSHTFADWHYLGKADNKSGGTSFTYVDKKNVRKSDGYVLFWMLLDFIQVQKVVNLNYQSLKVLYKADCNMLSTKTLSIVYYRENKGLGGVIKTFNYKAYPKIN